MRNYKAKLRVKAKAEKENVKAVKVVSEVRNLNNVFVKRNPETGNFPENKEFKQALDKLFKLTPEQLEKAQKTLKEQYLKELQASLEQTKMFIEHLKKLEEDKEKLQILEENNQILEKITNCLADAKIIKECSK